MSRVARIGASRNASLLRLLRMAFLVVAVGLPAYAVASRWDEVSGHLREIGWARAALCAPPMLAGLFCGMRAWRAILGGLGSDLPARPAARVYFVGQLGKYVPGAVWAVLAQMEFARDHDVPRRRSAAAFVIAVVVSLATGLIIAAATVPFVDAGRHPEVWWLLVPVPVLAAMLVPRVLWSCLRRVPVSRLSTSLPPVLPGRAMAVAATWASVGWLSYGLHVAILTAGFKGHGVGTLFAACVGGYALAWAIGLIAFMLPAGAGARDVALVLALSGVVATSPAIAVAVVSRAVTTVCDLLLAFAASVFAPRISGRSDQLLVEEVGRHVPGNEEAGAERQDEQPSGKLAKQRHANDDEGLRPVRAR
jgi:glycosyltransferase 2 family protein